MSAPPLPEQPPAQTRRRRGDKARQPETAPQGTAPADGMPEPPKLRRRPMLVALSILLTALGALLGAWLLTGLSGTSSYIAVAKDVERGQVIEEGDLIRTQLSADEAIDPVSWEQRRVVVGERAAYDMAAGSILTRNGITGEAVPPAGETIVGLALEAGQVPITDLKNGDAVRVIVLSDDSTGATPQQAAQSIGGTVSSVTTSPDGATRLVDVRVATGSAQTVSAYSARRQVALVLDSSDSGEGSGSGSEPAEPSEPSDSPSTSASPSS